MIFQTIITMISTFLVVFGGIFLVINIGLILMSLGYVLEEKHPNKKSMSERLELFYRNCWRKIIK